jgi:hypothetical protein
MTGAVGTAGGALISTPAVGREVQPLALVTVNVYDPAVRPVTVTDDTEPVMPPGLTVHDPAGRPLSTTLPVRTEHEGCVMVPTVGVGGNGLTVTAVVADWALWHPLASVTLTQ